MNKSLIPLFAFFFLLSGCSPFGAGKESKNIVANGLTPKVLYELAQEKLEVGSVDQAINQFELILSSYPNSKYAIQARLDIAYNLYKRKKYNRAIITLDNFIEKYPALKSTPYAYYLRGVVAEEKSSSLLDNLITDSAQRDVQSIQDSYKYYTILIEKFPDSKYSKEASTKLPRLVNALARHELYVALYYTRIGANIAAINRSKFIIENYPYSQSIPDSLNLMAYNYDEINAKILAKDTRNILSSSFPDYTPKYSLN
jgi:outer membrane protein assembly factor BamD